MVWYCQQGETPTDAPLIEGTPVHALLFADDLALISRSPEGLQTMIDRIGEYCQMWGMQVNVEKTKCMVFRKGGRRKGIERWFYRGKEVEVVITFKYLGLMYSTQKVWSHHVAYATKKAGNALFKVRLLTAKCPTAPLALISRLYDALVAQVVLYTEQRSGAIPRRVSRWNQWTANS